MEYAAEFTQQNGFVHAGIVTAGLDNACGIAAFTLMLVLAVSSVAASRRRLWRMVC